MKKVGDFQTKDPLRLSEQLDRFQDATVQETSEIRASFIPLPAQRLFSSATDVTATLLPGQIAICATNLGDLTVTLSPGSPAKPGWLALVKRFAASNLTIRPSGSVNDIARRINATTSLVMVAPGMRWVYFDGTDWWA